VRDLAVRFDDLETVMVHVIGDESKHQVRLDKVEIEVAGNDRTFAEIISDGAEFADRLGVLEERLEHERRARQLADDGNSAYIGVLEQRHGGLVSLVSELTTRLNALEQVAKDQARNENVHQVRFNGLERRLVEIENPRIGKIGGENR